MAGASCPLVFHPGDGEAVHFVAHHGNQEALQPGIGCQLPVEPANGADDWVFRFGVGNAPVTDDVVGQNQAAGMSEPQSVIEVNRVAFFVGINKYEIEGRFALPDHLPQCVGRRADLDRHLRKQPGPIDYLCDWPDTFSYTGTM